MPRRAFYRIVWVVSLLAILGMSLLFLLEPHAAPTAAAPLYYTTNDKWITLQHPGNWKPNEASGEGVETAVDFTPDAYTRLLVKVDLIGAILADLARPGADPGALPGIPTMPAVGRNSPLETVHAYQLQNMLKDTSRRGSPCSASACWFPSCS